MSYRVISCDREGWDERYSLLVDGFHELPNHQGDTLNPLDLLLGPDQLPFQAPAHKHSLVSSGLVGLSYFVWLVEKLRAPLLILDIFLL